MKIAQMGRTGLQVGCVGFELSPLKNRSYEEAARILQRAVGAGVTFFDIGLPCGEIQRRIGRGLAPVREKVVLAGSFIPSTTQELERDLSAMLRDLKTEYLDILQIHDPDLLPRPGDDSGLFDALIKAKEEGKIRHIGITTGNWEMAVKALEYGWYDTLQYPWSRGSEEEELSLLDFCLEAQVGSISVPPEEASEDLEADCRFLGERQDHVSLWLLDEAMGFEQLIAWGKG